MFIGQYEHSLDEKNRLFIPAKFRQGHQEFIVTRGLESCLFLFTKESWQQITEKLNALPLTQHEARSFIRLFASAAQDCDVDDQGRILIPKILKEYAVIKKPVTVIGVIDRIEIWDTQKWDKFYKTAKPKYEQTAEKLTELGI
ncbi:MAG: division/cell wall cluster transcriptional repressor MraZ [Elusimicrobia bacterium]|nr:division/cell wall cluster transcriptional repressor MraZ [Elusimicrobiota bacterium]